jgi:hypothetical protein
MNTARTCRCSDEYLPWGSWIARTRSRVSRDVDGEVDVGCFGRLASRHRTEDERCHDVVSSVELLGDELPCDPGVVDHCGISGRTPSYHEQGLKEGAPKQGGWGRS